MSSVRLIWENVLKARQWKIHSGGSVSGVFPPKLLTDPQAIPKMRHRRKMHWIESERMRGGKGG